MAKIALGTWAIGATKERHVVEATEAAKIQLTSEEVARLEALADATLAPETMSKIFKRLK